MSLWIEWEIDLPEGEHSKEDFEKLLQQSVEAALRFEHIETPVEVSLSIVSLEAIHEMNRDYRQVDRETDVLSFPLLSFPETPRLETPAAQDLEDAAEEEANLDPDTGEVVLGDVVLCLDKAKSQAQEYGHSLKREMAFLTVHSMLHLLGYDHMAPEEEKVMFDKQKAILDEMGIGRD